MINTSTLHPSPPTLIQDPPHGHWWKKPPSRDQMSWKDIKQPACPSLSATQAGQCLGSSSTTIHHYPPYFHSSTPWAHEGGRLMKHGEGITLTLTGRCPILFHTTINNMAASGTLASKKELSSESHVLTASCSQSVFSHFFRVRYVAFLFGFSFLHKLFKAPLEKKNLPTSIWNFWLVQII